MDIKGIDVSKKLKLYETSAKEKEVSKNNSEENKTTVNKKENQDKITISSEAKNLNFLDFAKSKIKYEMNRDLSDINNAEKINALKEQIKKGDYMIDSKDIANALVSGGYAT